jgi:hypothetical protein
MQKGERGFGGIVRPPSALDQDFHGRTVKTSLGLLRQAGFLHESQSAELVVTDLRRGAAAALYRNNRFRPRSQADDRRHGVPLV